MIDKDRYLAFEMH